MKIYGIKDKGAGFTQILMAQGDYMAQRIMTDIVNDRQPSLVTQYPGDFSLYRLGDLDQDTGVITPESDFIIEAVNLKKSSPSPTGPEVKKEQTS